MNVDSAKLKIYCEIAAYAFGALFLFTKLLAGQANAGMEVSLELERERDTAIFTQDNLAVLVKLKRGDIGRLEINDVVLKVSDLADPNAKPQVVRNPRLIKEFETPGGQASDTQRSNGTLLPPGDATQFAYWVHVKRGAAILVDATVVATRTGPWGYGHPEWRASAIALATEGAEDKAKMDR